MKELEKQEKWKWRAEEYRDNYTGKNMIRYFNQAGEYMKTEEKKSVAGAIFKGFAVALVIIVAVVAVVAALFGNTIKANFGSHAGLVIASETTNKPKVTVVSESAVHAGDNLNVNMTLRNDSGLAIKYIKVYINIYDASYKILATPTSETTDLKAGVSWNFNITVPNVPSAKHFQLVNYDAN
jgi:hypothetical protein